MDDLQQQERNNAAYQRMKALIAQTYPRGWFVAIADEQIVGAASNFRELESLLQAQGTAPQSALVVEAGVDYPDYVTILG